jgi:putative transposase
VFPTKKRARPAVAEYIEVFYNRTRLHSGLGYKTQLKSPTNTTKTAPTLRNN